MWCVLSTIKAFSGIGFFGEALTFVRRWRVTCSRDFGLSYDSASLYTDHVILLGSHYTVHMSPRALSPFLRPWAVSFSQARDARKGISRAADTCMQAVGCQRGWGGIGRSRTCPRLRPPLMLCCMRCHYAGCSWLSSWLSCPPSRAAAVAAVVVAPGTAAGVGVDVLVLVLSLLQCCSCCRCCCC